MSLSKIFDAATPPATVPAGCAGVLGYIGRPGFTPHVWTPEEWRRFSHLKQYPAYVPDLANDPVKEAENAVFAAEKLGWAKYADPHTRIIVIDLETAVVPGWYEKCAAKIGQGGYVSVAYGSLSTIVQNAAEDLLVADWNSDPHLLPGQTIHGHQYQTGAVDLSVVDEWFWERGGNGPRHG